MRRLHALIRTSQPVFLIALLLTGIVFYQLLADIHRPVGALATRTPRLSGATIRLIDAGLHLPVASLLWISKRLEILTLSEKNNSFLHTVELINTIDPQLSTPYAFSVLVMPTIRRCSYCLEAGLAIGELGVRQAEPDWRIAFYLGVEYFTTVKDKVKAAHYFDIAAHSSDAPANIRTFSLNYSSAANERAESKKIWRAVADSAEDEGTRQQALNYLKRLELFDFLQRAVDVYHARFGHYPSELNELVSAGILREVPPDPFGFTLAITPEGTIGFPRVEQSVQE